MSDDNFRNSLTHGSGLRSNGGEWPEGLLEQNLTRFTNATDIQRWILCIQSGIFFCLYIFCVSKVEYFKQKLLIRRNRIHCFQLFHSLLTFWFTKLLFFFDDVLPYETFVFFSLTFCLMELFLFTFYLMKLFFLRCRFAS